jgi:ATP-binding cassette subfamily F protein 3
VDYSRTVWEEARQAPSKLNEADRRNLLGSFLFSGEDIHKPVSVLSGGEKARLALFKLMLSESNLLILDEPTNHLDMKTKDLFQQALTQYRGTLLIVSHDRHFLDNLAERVIEVRDGRVYDYPGNYSWFLEKREELLKKQDEIGRVLEKKDKGRASEVEKQKAETQETEKREEKKRVSRKVLTSLEAGIAKMEGRRKEIDALLCLREVFSDPLRAQPLAREREVLELGLADAYRHWEELAPLLGEA